MSAKVPRSVSLPPELEKALKEYCARVGKIQSDVIREAIAAYIQQEHPLEQRMREIAKEEIELHYNRLHYTKAKPHTANGDQKKITSPDKVSKKLSRAQAVQALGRIAAGLRAGEEISVGDVAQEVETTSIALGMYLKSQGIKRQHTSRRDSAGKKRSMQLIPVEELQKIEILLKS